MGKQGLKAGVIVFPGSNCDRDVKVALQASGIDVTMVWHRDNSLPTLDLVVVPGGFSYGDYLRCGAISANSPIMREVKKHAEQGRLVLGICNGFQVLTETRMLPGTLMRNRNLKFICRDVYLKPENTATAFTRLYENAEAIRVPIAHHDGNYYADAATLKTLEDNGQIAFRYCDKTGQVNDASNPNGSLGNIAGILNKQKNILGLMPHPERVADVATGGEDGTKMFASLLQSLAA